MSFLLFFIVTVAVIVTSVFFSFQVPLRENDKLRKEVNIAEEEKLFMKAFEIKMQETVNLLDSVNLTVNAYRIENKIQNNIKDMTAEVDDAPSFLKGMCNQIIDNLSSLSSAKKEIRNFNKNTAEAEKKDQAIKELQHQLNICQMRLEQYARPVK